MHLTNEAIVTAIIQRGSISAAAQALDCSPRTLYSRMKKPAFQELYNQAKAELMKAAAAKLSNQAAAAVDVLTEVMNDPEAAAQTRVNAAANVIQYAQKLATAADFLERLEELERRAAEDEY